MDGIGIFGEIQAQSIMTDIKIISSRDLGHDGKNYACKRAKQ